MTFTSEMRHFANIFLTLFFNRKSAFTNESILISPLIQESKDLNYIDALMQ